MAMNARLLRPRASGAFDPAAQVYFNAVAAADGQQLEPAVKKAISDFVKGCKADGIWSAIKASCILSGARTLSGALTPLVGTAPTNFNFVTGDYDRKTGLVGNGVNKYLNTNRNNNVDGQNDKHMAVFVSTATTSSASGNGTFATYIGVGDGSSGAYLILRSPNNSTFLLSRSHNASGDNIASGGAATGLIGSSRSGSANYVFRHSGSNSTVTRASQSPFDGNITVSGAANTTAMNGRLAFYSIGSAIDLALLDTRVAALYTAIGAAI